MILLLSARVPQGAPNAVRFDAKCAILGARSGCCVLGRKRAILGAAPAPPKPGGGTGEGEFTRALLLGDDLTGVPIKGSTNKMGGETSLPEDSAFTNGSCDLDLPSFNELLRTVFFPVLADMLLFLIIGQAGVH